METNAKHIFTWTVQNFRACNLKNGNYLESPTFTARSLDETTWCLQLYPNGRKIDSEGFITCCLKRLENSPGPDEGEYDFTFKATDGNNKVLVELRDVRKFKKGTVLGWEKPLKISTLKTNLNFTHGILNFQATLRKRWPDIFTQNSCWTKIATDNYSFKWNVKNVASSTPDTKLVSFSEKLQFDITLETPEDDVEIRIKKKKLFAKSQKLMCSVSLLNLKNGEHDSIEAVFKADDLDVEHTWTFPTFFKRSKIASKDKCLEEDYFTLQFDFVLSNNKRKDIVCKRPDLSSSAKQDFSASLKSDLKRLFTESVHTDVSLHVGEQMFRVHKIILCARSPVFSAMFNQDMVESQTSAIIISDVEAGTVNSLLEFMYTGDTEVLDYESALKLLLAADKYQVLALKELCSSSLESFMSDENVCDILFTADLIQQESLKVCAVDHIKDNCDKIFKSSEWHQLHKKNFILASEIVSDIIGELT